MTYLLTEVMNDAVRGKFQDSSQRIYADSLRKKYTGMNGVSNGHVTNTPNMYSELHISVNPLQSDTDMSTAPPNYQQVTTYVPNGTSHHSDNTYVPNGIGHHSDNTYIPNGIGHHSDNNFNKINGSVRSMDGSLLRHHDPDDLCSIQQQPIRHEHSGHMDSLGGGGGEALACPPSPTAGSHNNCFDQYQSDQSARSCDMSCDRQCDNGVHTTVGYTGSKQHRHRRKRRSQGERSGHESPGGATRDQATNTDLSSNGEYSHYPSVTSNARAYSNRLCLSIRLSVTFFG